MFSKNIGYTARQHQHQSWKPDILALLFPQTYVILKKDQSNSGCWDIKRTTPMFPFDTIHRVLAIPFRFSSPELSPSQHSCPEVRYHRPTPGPSHVQGPLHQSGEPYMEPLEYFYIFLIPKNNLVCFIDAWRQLQRLIYFEFNNFQLRE